MASHPQRDKEAGVTIHFVVHEDGDSVGVVVVEGVKAGATLTGWVMEQDRTLTMKALDDIPIGHKLAIRDLAQGDTVVKYGVDIAAPSHPSGRAAICTSTT